MGTNILNTNLGLRDRWVNRQRFIVTTRKKIIDADKPDSSYVTFIENKTKKQIEINEIGLITTGKEVYRKIFFDKNPPIVINKGDHKEIEQIWTRRIILNPDAEIGFDRFDISVKEHLHNEYPHQKIQCVYAKDSTGHPHKGKIVSEVRDILDF